MKVLVAVVGLASVALVVLVAVFVLRAWFGAPIQVLGFGAPPAQPIAFPHTKHVQDAGINCLFCHRNVTTGKAATVPAVEQCMFCHKVITGTGVAGQYSAELTKLKQASDDKQPINWERVHRMPDHVRFAHEPHLTFFTLPIDKGGAGLEAAQVCQVCHGDVGSMTVVQQVDVAEVQVGGTVLRGGGALKMADCVNCHRQYSAPTDCVICHH